MLGHKDALAYGSMWYNQPGRSDVKSVCGNYPAVVDWDLGGIESGSELNVDAIPFFRIRQYVEQGYRRNGVTILSWNPSLSFLLRKDSLQNVVRSVLSGNESRVELHEVLGLTGAEVSVNNLPAGAGVPFVHAHKENEEIYGVLEGAGSVTIDGEEIELAAGDWLRISPAAHRQFRAASDSGITYVCIQVKQGSLDAFTADDAIMF